MTDPSLEGTSIGEALGPQGRTAYHGLCGPGALPAAVARLNLQATTSIAVCSEVPVSFQLAQGAAAMAKAYWIAAYRSVKDPGALAGYAKLGAPALQKHGGRILARGLPAQVYDGGLAERTVLLEFDSVAQAVAAHDSPEYQEALRLLGDAVDRDLRIVEGLD